MERKQTDYMDEEYMYVKEIVTSYVKNALGVIRLGKESRKDNERCIRKLMS